MHIFCQINQNLFYLLFLTIVNINYHGRFFIAIDDTGHILLKFDQLLPELAYRCHELWNLCSFKINKSVIFCMLM